jgi:nucleoside-diphosphate-sugar epimerase
MRICIVGGTSSLGLTLKPALSTFSEVITAGRNNCDVTIDLSDINKTIVLPPNLDTVIHTSAMFGGVTDRDIIDTEILNVIGTLRLCQAAQQAKVKHFIFVSSIYATLPETSRNFSIYALSKRQAEENARFYCGLHNMSLTILQPAPLYGNSERLLQHQPFLNTIISSAETGRDISIYGEYDALRNYLHVEDLAEVLVRVIKQNIVGTYTCTAHINVSCSQIALAALAAFESKASLQFIKDKPAMSDNIFPKDEVLYNIIGFYPGISIEEGMMKIKNYRSARA